MAQQVLFLNMTTRLVVILKNRIWSKDCVVLHSYFTSDYYQLYSTQLSTDTGVEHVTFFIYNKIVDEPEEHVQIHTIDSSSGVVNPVMEPIYDEPTTTTSVPL